jgi:hypothetical protein
LVTIKRAGLSPFANWLEKSPCKPEMWAIPPEKPLSLRLEG